MIRAGVFGNLGDGSPAEEVEFVFPNVFRFYAVARGIFQIKSIGRTLNDARHAPNTTVGTCERDFALLFDFFEYVFWTDRIAPEHTHTLFSVERDAIGAFVEVPNFFNRRRA